VIRPTSPTQYESTINRGELPPPEQVAPGTWVVPLAVPSIDVPYTLCYVLIDADGAAHLIDPGVDTDENADRLFAFLDRIGVTEVASATATHLHFDHVESADRIRRRSGARVQVHREEEASAREMAADVETAAELMARWGVPADRILDVPPRRETPLSRFSADVLLEGGELLEIPGRHVEVIWTPGHTRGSITLRDLDHRLLFTGDHLLPLIFPGLGLGGPVATGPIGQYLDSLDRIRGFDDHEVCPGHYYRFFGVEERCADTAAHHLKRSREVAELLDSLPGASVWEIAERITWTAGWDNLPDLYRLSALAQTDGHIRYLRSLV
jgi:glyoxylase-like metal-dependent hydrolase (beta-lactamase superfamily II)